MQRGCRQLHPLTRISAPRCLRHCGVTSCCTRCHCQPSASETARCYIGSLDRSIAARHLARHDARSPTTHPRPSAHDRKGLYRVGPKLLGPLAQRVLMDVQIARSLSCRNPAPPTRFTASGLSSGLNFHLRMAAFGFTKSPISVSRRNRRRRARRMTSPQRRSPHSDSISSRRTGLVQVDWQASADDNLLLLMKMPGHSK